MDGTQGVPQRFLESLTIRPQANTGPLAAIRKEGRGAMRGEWLRANGIDWSTTNWAVLGYCVEIFYCTNVWGGLKLGCHSYFAIDTSN